MDVIDWASADVDLGFTFLVNPGWAMHVDGDGAGACEDVPQKGNGLHLSVPRVLELQVDAPSP
eukprot:6637241-Pyramimonas_sp.AAC.1